MTYKDDNGNLLPEQLSTIPYASHYNPHGLAVGDINGDGSPDVAIADYNNGLVVLYNKARWSSISGRVTNKNSDPLQGISVSAYNTHGDFISASQTDKNGNYSLGGLAVGDYKIKFFDPNRHYLSKYYNDNADLIQVTAVGQTITGKDAQLTEGKHILGNVTDESGTPLSNIFISAFDASNTPVAFGLTDANGNYSVGGFTPDLYKILFFDPASHYAYEFYNDKLTLSLANLIQATSSQDTTGINAKLAIAGHINGKVTNTLGRPLSNIYVSAIYSQDGALPVLVKTNENGEYSVGGLPAGNYKVKFFDVDDHYDTQFYNGKTDENSADLVQVSTNTITNLTHTTLTRYIDPPYDLNISVSGTSLKLDWTSDDTTIAGYEVERSRDKVSWNTIARTSSESYHDSNISQCVSYCYRVRAYDSEGYKSDYSDIASDMLPDTTPPTAPTNLSARFVPGVAIPINKLFINNPSSEYYAIANINWSPASDNIGVAGYMIERSTDLSNWYTIGKTDTNTTSFRDPASSYSANINYYYRVIAYDAAGNLSNYSNVASTLLDTIPPSPPTKIWFPWVGTNSLTISWDGATDNVGVTSYRVDIMHPGDIFQTIAWVSGTSYTIDSLTPANLYAFRITSRDQFGNLSSPSTTAYTSTLMPPPPPYNPEPRYSRHFRSRGGKSRVARSHSRGSRHGRSRSSSSRHSRRRR